MAFADIAPRISKFRTKAQVDADFAPVSSSPPVIPDPTDEQVEQCYDLLKDPEAANGYLGIARTVGITVTQVKDIHREIRAALAYVEVELESALVKGVA